MTKRKHLTATGPHAFGFRTHGANIDVGADMAGNDFGVRGHSDNGPGVFGESGGGIGVKATSSTQEAVQGSSGAAAGVSGNGTPGVLGVGNLISAENLSGNTGHYGVMGLIRGKADAGVFGGHRNFQATALDVKAFTPAPNPGPGCSGSAPMTPPGWRRKALLDMGYPA